MYYIYIFSRESAFSQKIVFKERGADRERGIQACTAAAPPAIVFVNLQEPASITYSRVALNVSYQRFLSGDNQHDVLSFCCAFPPTTTRAKSGRASAAISPPPTLSVSALPLFPWVESGFYTKTRREILSAVSKRTLGKVHCVRGRWK